MTIDTLSTSAPVTADPFLTDPTYRHEARQALNTHLEACHDALQQAGVTPPTWPTLDDQTVSGLAAQMLWLQRWIISFDPGTMKQHLSPVPTNAFVLTKEQIQKNIQEILPGYRLIEKPLYDQLTAKQNDRFLQVDFSHRLTHGINIKDELVETLSSIQDELGGMAGALLQLLQTSEENKLCASIAACMEQELNSFGSLFDVFHEETAEAGGIEGLTASLKDLYEMNGVLLESLSSSEKKSLWAPSRGGGGSKINGYPGLDRGLHPAKSNSGGSQRGRCRMSPEAQRPALSRTDGFKILDGEKLLLWLAQTAEEAMWLDYELSKIRAPNLKKGEVE